MLIYNVTVNIDEEVHDTWLEWMQDEHIPAVMECGLFNDSHIFRVLADDEGFTYSIQYTCTSMGKLESYFEKHAPKLQEEHKIRFNDKFVAFRTILEEIV